MPSVAVLADVIFPAPTYPYVVGFFWPVAGILALAAEFGVFAAFQRGMRLSVVMALVLAANLFSWFAGILLGDYVLTGHLPSGIVTRGAPGDEILIRGPDFYSLASWSLVGACVLSFVLELAFLHVVLRIFRIRTRKLPACVGLANIASYGVLLLFTSIVRPV